MATTAGRRELTLSVSNAIEVAPPGLVLPASPLRLVREMGALGASEQSAVWPDRALFEVPLLKDNVARLPAQTPLGYSFDVRQQWEGVVTSVSEDEFGVVLRDTRNATAPEYEAVLPLEEIAEDDLALVKVGAVLYWTIGYKQSRTGQLERVSNIRLRRLPAWTQSDVRRVTEAAAEFDELFKDE